MRLNLGCGRDVRPDHVNVDRVPLPGISAVVDLEQPLPFRTASFDEILTVHVLEHVDRFLPLMEELHRVLRPGGILRIIVPHLSFYGSYTDPTHRRFFGYRSFDYFTEEGDYNFYSRARFRIRDRRLVFFWANSAQRQVPGRLLKRVINSWPRFYERFACWWLPVNEVRFELEAVPSA